MIMYNVKFFAVLFAALIVAVCHGKPPRAIVTVHVTNAETGAPLEAALAGISFTVLGDRGAATDLRRSGLTDANGDFRAAENTMFYIGVGAQKAGYYKTGLSVDL